MAELTHLAEALRQLTRFLDEEHIRYMVIGGVANLVWGNGLRIDLIRAGLPYEEAAWGAQSFAPLEESRCASHLRRI